MMKFLVLRGSPRKDGITNIFADAFVRGAKKNAEVFDVNLCEKNIEYCRGCYACVSLGKCVIEDDMQDLLNLVRQSEVIVCFTPLYFYSVSAQMKTFLDRCFPLVSTAKTDSQNEGVSGKKLLAFVVGGGRKSSFEAVSKAFEMIADDLKMNLSAVVCRGESVYFSELGEESKRIKKILSAAEQAGEELSRGILTEECVKTIELPIAPSDVAFEARSKLYWNLLRGKK